MSKTNKKLNISELLVVSRPFWWVNTAAPFVASYGIIAGNFDITLFVGIIFFAFGYNLLMYGVNDIFDYETDIKNPRKLAAGIEGSVFPKAKHQSLWFWMMVINIPLVCWLLLNGPTNANIWLIFMLFMVFAYSVKGLRFKEIPFVDSPTSSFHYTSPFIYGGLLAGASELYIPAFAVFFIWVMANHAFGAIQDIKPDNEAGVKSIATALGAEKTIIFVLSGYALAALLPLLAYGINGLIASILLLPYVVIVARTLPARRNSDSPLFRRGWRQFLYANYAVGFAFTLLLIKAFML
jgi:4-hydroxybenzoate polyprenyltransferase